MNTFVIIIAFILAVAATVTPIPRDNSSSQTIISDDRFVKIDAQPKSPNGRTGSGRIFNGIEVSAANQANYKHQVKLVTKKPHGSFGCGGTIISKRAILTAAHCLKDGESTTVYFGVLDQTNKQNAQKQTVNPSGWRMHEAYDDDEIVNDIAVILLAKDIEFSNVVGKVELPPKGMSCASFASNNPSVIISGWGTINDANTAATILRYANIKVASTDKCDDIYHSSFHHDTMLCADATNSGTCQGDSGGPMIWNNKGKPTVIGAVSFGAENCEHSMHRVFTCVSAFIPWIAHNTAGYL